MKREPISYYLKNPSSLIELSITQIEKWLKESPYSQPLRMLLAKKQHYNQELILDSATINAATVASNRAWLYRELHGNVAFQSQANTSENHTVDKPTENIAASTSDPITHSKTSDPVLPTAEPEVIKIDKEDTSSELDIPNHEVHYEEVILSTTLTEDTEIVEYQEIAIDITSDNSTVEKAKNESDTPNDPDITVEVINTTDQPISDDAEHIDENVELESKELKGLDLPPVKSLDSDETTSNFEVVRVETDEEFVAGRDENIVKKDIIKNKKQPKNKAKTSKPKKSKKKAKKKPTDELENSVKKAQKKKNLKRVSKKIKSLNEIKGEKDIQIVTSGKQKSKAKPKKKKTKVKLLKYDIPVSPIEEEANHYTDSRIISDYTQWLLQFDSDSPKKSFKRLTITTKQPSEIIKDSSSTTASAKAKEKKVKRKKKAIKNKSTKTKSKSKADLSLEANEEIISELWADLLAKQGHIKKARKMYLKLSLKYPEKSSYFATKLDNL